MALVPSASHEGTSLYKWFSSHLNILKNNLPLDSGALLIFHVYSETVEVENTDDGRMDGKLLQRVQTQ